jgi:SAM-dependent MidA family methyltransferase
VVLANEVLDALPVSRFRIANGEMLALGVGWSDGRFRWLERPATAAQRAVIERLAADLHAPQWPEGYCSEYCPGLANWLAAVTRPLKRGLMVAIDYGLPRREYYHRQRSAGTLICHYRHRAHADPFFYPGLQDISAWVDFTAVAEAAQAAGLHLDAYGTQAGFLLANGLAEDRELLAGASPAVATAAAALRQLLLPGEMGETFKIIAVGRGLAAGALDVGRDLSHLL